MIGKRQAIIIWLHSLKSAKYFRKFGNIHYVSKRLKYVVLYVDMDDMEKIKKKVEKLPFVKGVDISYKPYLKTEYEKNSKRDNKEKEYDYKLGI